VLGELLPIAALELLEALRIVAEPAPELRARRELARPLVEPCLLTTDAAGPEPVDEDAIAVVLGGRVVRALERDVELGQRAFCL
jgi:hypothetical protein